MHIVNVYALLGIIVAFASIVTACSPGDNVPIIGKVAKLINVEPSTTSIKHDVYGSVTFTTPCNFSIRNLTIIPTGNAVYWYGIPVDNKTYADPFPRVVEAALGSYNGQTQSFTIDPHYNLTAIAVMMMYSEGDNRAYGAFPVMGNVSNYFSNTPSGAGVVLDPNDPMYIGSGTKERGSSFVAIIVVAAFVMAFY